jgi:translation initiation factor IF-2
MAKIRIYELARDLNMTNKVLLQKIKELEIPVKSHMSSLDDEVITRIKTSLLGLKSEEVEETRIQPTVIRRRKKPIVEKVLKKKFLSTKEEDESKQPVEPKRDEEPIGIEKSPVTEAVENEAAQKEGAKEIEAAQKEGVEEIEAAQKEGVEEIEAAQKEETIKEVDAKPALVVTEPNKLKRETEREKPAKIIKKPEALKPVEETPEVLEPEIIEKSEPENVVPIKTAVEQPVPLQKTAETDRPEAITPEKPVALKPVKLKKRDKKEAPAKIIKLGVVPAIEKSDGPPQVDEISRKPALNKAAAPEETKPEEDKTAQKTAAKDKKKKIKKITPQEATRDKKFFKKKISFRRKEVVEGVDLYAGGRRNRKTRKGQRRDKTKMVAGQKTQITVSKAIKRRIKIDDAIVLSDLAKRMSIKANEMIKKLMDLGVMATVNQTIDFDTACLVAAEFDYELERAVFEEQIILKKETDDPEKLMDRPPVVTIMGHVDHGKTSLLDTIRESRITEHEAGGITQHIGAYHVATKNGQIVFLDTPGHEAFTEMRSRGAQVTDIVVLVVAADDGVMPQTLEAINHSKAANVPIIVAINKIDKPGAEPERVQRELAEAGLTPEDWGGDTIFVRVSAKQNQGIDELLEMILLQAEVLEVKANPNKLASGHVVEARLDSGRGPVATILVQEGTLKMGDAVVCGIHYGKIRAMLDDMGTAVDMAGPSIPVEIIGLSGVPNAGDELIALADEKNARQVSAHRIQKQRAKELAKTSRVSLESLFEKMREGEVQELNLVLKADVHGSIEALKDSLIKLSNEEVKINIIHSATGTISESDVSLAAVSNAIIIGFNVRPNPKVQSLAAEENVDMRFYNIIYDVIKNIKDAIVGMMSSTFEEHTLGRAEIREVFHIPKLGAIAGCFVEDGKIKRGQNLRLVRDGVIIYKGKLSSLRRFKDDIKEVQRGYECGIGIENYNDIKIGDIIECYYMQEIRPEIEA